MIDRISATLITRNRPEHFIGCFSSLVAQSYKNWDAVIVDGSSEDKLLEKNRSAMFLIKTARDMGHDIKLVRDGDEGISQAWQKGMELANPESEFGQRLEDDIWLHQDYLKHLHDMIITDEKIGAVGGLSPNAWNFATIEDSEFKNDFYKSNGNLIPEDRQCCFINNPSEYYEVAHLHGLFLYRKKAIEDVGGFGVHMTRVAHRDETDLTLRMWFADQRLLVNPKAWLRHDEAPDGGSRGGLTVQERTGLQMKDELAFQTRLKYLQEQRPDKKLPIRGEV